MKNFKFSITKIFLFCFVTCLSVGCEKFLDRKPQDFLSEEAYFNKASDLELFVNKFYSSFYVNNDYGVKSVYGLDNNSDNQIGPSENENFLKGFKLVPSSANNKTDAWNFSQIRECNYFIKTVDSRISEGVLDGENSDVRHFSGENYFFRAWLYFNKLQSFGDVPIITNVLSDDKAELIKASKRSPRSKVARFILSDLEKAMTLLNDRKSKNRISLSTAQLLAARVSLLEASWLKYHKGTAMVPGNNLWPGSKTYPNFSFESGSIEQEIEFFYNKAIAYSEKVADTHALATDYRAMFVSESLSNNSEVLLCKSYGIGVVLGHGTTHFLQRTGSGCGFTRSFVETFLMQNGLPIYADKSEYKGDKTLVDVVEKRDLRLQESVLTRGDVRLKNTDGSMELFDFPVLTKGSGWQGVTSGYQLEKWMSVDPIQASSITAGTTACPIFRAAEAYLIYLEAYYELNSNINAKADSYWKQLRARAGVDTDYKKTIANTILEKENDFAVKSASKLIDATLYNIRRERRCEFIAEGMRLNDLYRWRSLDNMENYIVEGFNLWDDMYKNYEDNLIQGRNVSNSPEKGGSKYFQPFRKITTNRAYNGYNFPKAHYLNPIPLDQFALTNSIKDGILYQNPGWSKVSASAAN